MDPHSLIAAALAWNLEALPVEEIKAPERRREAAHHAGQHVHVDPPEPPRFTPPEPPVMDNSTLTAANIAARRAAEARRRAGRIASLYYTQTPTPLLP